VELRNPHKHPENGMPSPMDENDNRMNIDASPLSDATLQKRKLDGSSEELSFPCKKLAVTPAPAKTNPSDIRMTPTKSSMPQVKLSKAEREALKLLKAQERETERLKREEERLRREQEKQRREEQKQKKVVNLLNLH